MNELSAKQIEETIARLEKLARTKIRNKKIKAITVNPGNHALPKMKIEVGKICGNLEEGAAPEKVLVIFEGTAFMVCTETRGISGGLPYFFVRSDVRLVEEY